MNREKGVSSLALVLMLLILGSLLLQGMSQQDRSFASRVSMESQSLRRQAIVQVGAGVGENALLADAARSSVLTVCCHRCPGLSAFTGR